VTVDVTVIRLDDKQYWLYATVGPETKGSLHAKLESTRTKVLARGFFAELREKHDVGDAVFLVDGATPLKDTRHRHGLELGYEQHGTRNGVERSFVGCNDELPRSRTVSATSTQQPLISG